MSTALLKRAACLFALSAGLLTVPGTAHADNLPTELLPRLIEDGPGKQQALEQTVQAWTLDRMAAAMTSETGTAVPDAEMTEDGEWDDKARPWPRTQGLVSRTVGKLFMQMKRPNGTTYDSTCSANIVTSANKSVVVTAGHCLKLWVPFTEDAQASSVIFVPGFDGSALRRGQGAPAPTFADVAPHGIWVATRAYITWGWNRLANWTIGHDLGALAVQKPGEARPIADVLGAQQIRFGQPRDVYAHAFGYPSDNVRNWYAPANAKVVPELRRTFDGRGLFHSKANAVRGSVYVDLIAPSALSPGTSGGPWFEGFDEATGVGVQTAISSRFDNPDDASPNGWRLGPNMVGQHLGDEERLTYEAAQAVPITP
jgi:hypothetical protein